MNINDKIKTLEQITGYPVKADVYNGKSEKYITYTYEDERGALFADNNEQETTVYLQISLYTPENFDYFNDKKKIKKKLKKEGFNIETIKSWIENSDIGRARHTVFLVNYTDFDN